MSGVLQLIAKCRYHNNLQQAHKITLQSYMLEAYMLEAELESHMTVGSPQNLQT